MPQSKRPGQWWKTTTLTIGTIPRYSENGVLANFMWTRALATVWCTFCRPRLPNSAPSPSVFNFCDFELQIELSVQSCALFSRQLLQIEPRTCGNRDYFGDHGSRKPLYPKKTQGFTPERSRGCFHPWIPVFPNCYTSQLLDDGWLTWWCGCHDGGTANRDNRP